MEKKNKKEKKPHDLNMKANLTKTKTKRKNALFLPTQGLKNYIILNKVISTSTLSPYYNIYHYL